MKKGNKIILSISVETHTYVHIWITNFENHFVGYFNKNMYIYKLNNGCALL